MSSVFSAPHHTHHLHHRQNCCMWVVLSTRPLYRCENIRPARRLAGGPSARHPRPSLGGYAAPSLASGLASKTDDQRAGSTRGLGRLAGLRCPSCPVATAGRGTGVWHRAELPQPRQLGVPWSSQQAAHAGHPLGQESPRQARPQSPAGGLMGQRRARCYRSPTFGASVGPRYFADR